MRWIGLVSGLLGSAIADQGKNGPEPVPDPATAESPNLEIPELDGKIPTPEQLLQVLDSMTGLSEEEKAKLKEDLLRNVQDRASAAYGTLAGNDLTTQTIVLLSLLAIVALIFGLEEKLSAVLSEPAKRKLLDILTRYKELEPNEKKQLEKGLLGKLKNSLDVLASNSESSEWSFRNSPYIESYLLFSFAVVLVILLLVFFVYKLFKCLSEREQKREEKKRNKQSKKKK